MKELNLAEGRNTGIPTAIKKINENGSPLPKLLTDEDRTFFSVIVPIHQAFIDNNPMNSEQVPKKRRSRTEIMKQIMELLQTGELSSGEVYTRLGYSGNPSKTFSNCVEKLITDGYIEYTSQKVNASDNTLRIKK